MRSSQMPPLQFLRECFDVDPGCPSGLRWKNRPLHHFKRKRAQAHFNNCWAGEAAGGLKPLSKTNTQAYWVVAFSGYKFYTHRLVWFMVRGVDPGAKVVDHIDGNPSNNAHENLRLATQSDNQCNRRAITGKAFKGTTFHKKSGLYHAKIKKSLGYYKTEEEAARAYQAAAEILQKGFAVHLSRPGLTLPDNYSPMDLIRELLKGTSDI